MALFSRKPPKGTLVAAAHIANPEERGDSPKYTQWQDEAWAMYDALGEFRQGITWLSNVVSRARLVAAFAPEHPGDEPEPIDDENDPAVQLVALIGGGIGGQSELLRSATVHLTVPGEGWFLAESTDSEMSWKFYSADEIRRRTTEADGQTVAVYQVRTGTSEWRSLPPESLLIRVFQPHDRLHWQADSSTRAALPIMRRLELLNRQIDAIAQSRLAMNGIYWIPSEAEFPANPNYPDAQNPFTAELMDLALQSIRTPGSASAAVPFFATMSAELLDKIRHDKFFDEADKELLPLREFEINRLATAIDIPPEVLLGKVGLNHWGAWQVEESALKTTVMTRLELICWAFTTGYLSPALQAADERSRLEALISDLPDIPSDGRQRIVWYDVSELSVRPDRSQDAQRLSDALLLNSDVTLRESGFDPTDMPEGDDLRRLIGLKLVQNPATAEAGFELLGLNVSSPVNLGPGRSEVALPNGSGASEQSPPKTQDAVPSSNGSA